MAIEPTPSGEGYWLLGADGGVFAFGDATFLGSGHSLPAATRAAEPFVDLVAVGPDGSGYVLVQADGGASSFGDAPAHGPLPGRPYVAWPSPGARRRGGGCGPTAA